MDKLRQLKKLVLELHALGEDEQLAVEDFVELALRKIAEAIELLPEIPDNTSYPPMSPEEVDAIEAALTKPKV